MNESDGGYSRANFDVLSQYVYYEDLAGTEKQRPCHEDANKPITKSSKAAPHRPEVWFKRVRAAGHRKRIYPVFMATWSASNNRRRSPISALSASSLLASLCCHLSIQKQACLCLPAVLGSKRGENKRCSCRPSCRCDAATTRCRQWTVASCRWRCGSGSEKCVFKIKAEADY